MKLFSYFFLFVSFSMFSQESIDAELLSKEKFKNDQIISVDNFGTVYSLDNNTLYKTVNNNSINYSNVQLGEIDRVDLFNPLKINLFYKDFNTVIVLDNRLAEIFKIDFNFNENYKNASFISTGNDNTIWVYNQDSQQLELFDYKANNTRVVTLPILSNIFDLKSNYNYCWLLTKDYLYQYNYFASLVLKIKNDGFTEIAQTNGKLLLKKDNSIYYLEKDSSTPIKIKLPKLLINAFFVNNETLYIYDNEFLYKYQLKIN